MDLQTWIQALGPTGAIVALGVAFMRGIWPFIRDQYLAKQVDSLSRLVVLMERADQRQSTMEGAITALNVTAQDIRTDQAALYAALDLEQPTRPRGRARAAAAGAK